MQYHLLETLGIVFALGMVSQWIAWKFRFPVIVLLTTLGIIAGPIVGLINPIETFGHLLHPLVELAVAIILFEGGLLLKFHEFEKTSKGMIRLFSVAVILNWFLGAIAGHYIGGLNWGTSLLIAGILIVTGPTVIIPALREAKLIPSTSSYLKWEGIVNDPIGAIIAVMVYEYIVFAGDGSTTGFIFMSLFKIVAISVALSFGIRFVVLWLSKRALIPEFLKVPFMISSILLLFIASEHLQKGSGLLTITLFGILLGNSNFSSLREIKRFGESISVFTVAAIFIILSASLDLKVWLELNWQHFVFIFLMAFIVRPVGIYLSTFKSGMRKRERLFIGLYGPRGIVAASIAGAVGTGLYEYGYAEGRFVLPIIFSVILLTVIVHSLWLNYFATKFDLKNHGENGVLIVGASSWSIQLARKLQELGKIVLITDVSWHKLAKAKMENIPVHYGHLLQDIERGEPDVSAINYLITTTEDDNYNALVCTKLRHTFGSDHVYQIPIHEDNFSKFHNLSKKEFCVLDDSTDALFENMIRNYHHGWDFKATELSAEYNLERFKSDNPKGTTIPFMIIQKNGRVVLMGREKSFNPQLGDMLVYYSPPK